MIKQNILNLLENANEYEYTEYTNFLTPNEYIDIKDKYKNLNIYSFGIIRKIFAFVPNTYTNYTLPITLIKISVNNKFKNYKNKDFLGSIMNLKIDRKYIGDIFTKDNTAYLYVKNNVLDIILNNLNKIGNNNCNISVVDELINLDFEYEFLNLNVSSLRLDVIISKLTNLSRIETEKMLTEGLCQINYEICTNKSYMLKQNDIISIKKYGRYMFNGVIRHSKKGKPVVEIKKWVN